MKFWFYFLNAKLTPQICLILGKQCVTFPRNLPWVVFLRKHTTVPRSYIGTDIEKNGPWKANMISNCNYHWLSFERITHTHYIWLTWGHQLLFKSNWDKWKKSCILPIGATEWVVTFLKSNLLTSLTACPKPYQMSLHCTDMDQKHSDQEIQKI